MSIKQYQKHCKQQRVAASYKDHIKDRSVLVIHSVTTPQDALHKNRDPFWRYAALRKVSCPQCAIAFEAEIDRIERNKVR